MRIILNADGFGRDEDSIKAAAECFAAGSLSSATIMPDGQAVEKAIEYALKHPEYSFGVYVGKDASVDVLKGIERIKERGVSVSHVALGAILDPARMDVLARVLRQMQIKRARSVPDVYLKRRGFLHRWADSVARRRMQTRFITTDRLLVLGDLTEARALQEWMPAVTDESLEVGVQPGFVGEVGNAHRQAIQSFARRAIDAGHHLITWNQL